MKLWRFTLRQIKSRPGRATLTLLSIVLGVAAVVAVSIATAATRQAYNGMFMALAGRADLEVVGLAGESFPEGEVLSWLSQVPGVQAVTPVVQKQTVIYLSNMERFGTSVMGIDPQSSQQFRDFKLVDGSFFGDGPSLVLEHGFARGLQLKVGDKVEIIGRDKRSQQKSQRYEVPVAGLFESREAASLAQGGMVLMSLSSAREILYSDVHRAPQPVTAIQIILDKGADRDQIQATIAARLEELNREGTERQQQAALVPDEPVDDESANVEKLDGLHVELSVRPPIARTQQAEMTQQQTEMGLRLATALSLVVAVFIILNTFLMNVSERRRQLGIMRAIGATRKQVMRMLVQEGLAMGVAGTIIGTGVGLCGAYFLTKAMTQLGRAAVPPLDLTWSPFALGAAFGMGISFAGTYLPARRAGKLSPLEGMAAMAPEDRDGFPIIYTILGAGIVVVTLGILTGCIMGWLPMYLAIGSAVTLLIGLVLLLPKTIGTLASVAAAVLKPLLGVEGRLAHRQILRRRTRTSLTIGVLFVAISTGIGLAGTLVDNVREIQDWYHRTVVGDFFVRAMLPNNAPGSVPDIPPETEAEIAAIPGVEMVETMRWVKTDARHNTIKPGETEPATEQVTVIIRDFKSPDHVSLALVDGTTEEVRAGLMRGEAVIGTVVAQNMSLSRGDKIRVDTPSGEQQFVIVGTTNEYNYGGLAIYLERKTAAPFFGDTGVSAFIVSVADGAEKQVGSHLQNLCIEQGWLLNSFDDIARLIEGLMAGVIGCLWGLLFLGFVVAAFGIVNTLTMNVLEQTRELGLLRIVAMTQGQVRKMILGQAAIMGFLGLVPGIVTGVGIAWLVNKASMPGTGHPIQFEFHPVMMAVSFAAAFLIVVLAAWAPAERAARLELVRALQYE
ncbi:MAG: FtsX-like permease family protein [Pirellulales bacterium]